MDASSLGDILEETDWDLGTDVSMATTPVGTRGPAQAEKEIRYGDILVCMSMSLYLVVSFIPTLPLLKYNNESSYYTGGGVLSFVFIFVQEERAWE